MRLGPTALERQTLNLTLALALACGSRAAPPPDAPEAAPSAPAPAAPNPPAPNPPGPNPAAPNPAAPDTYPTPFTAEQIRGATREGRAYTWRVEVSGEPPSERTITFTEVGPEGATIVRDGVARRVTWEELRQHAQFPRERVTTREETLTVPAGTYACVVYVVADPGTGETSTFYFAKALPGAPVLFFSEKGGVRQMTNTLVRHVPGGGG